MIKKIFKTILLLIIGFSLIAPASTTHAAMTKRFYRAYRSQLKGFLNNYRGSTSDRQGCLRSSKKPDGLFSDCLSLGKINKIMSQLDEAGYFTVKEPTSRRQYLLATPKQPYVMRKVVMYFEQILNPETVIYGADAPNENQNYDMVDATLINTWTLASLAGQVASGDPIGLGDHKISALAFDQQVIEIGGVHTWRYSLKPKSMITEKSLKKIYGIDPPFPQSRMYPFRANCIPAMVNWTATETTTLNKLLDIVNKEYKFLLGHRKSATWSKAMMDAERNSALILGLVGAESSAGVNITKRAAAFGLKTTTLGTETLSLDGKWVWTTFFCSQLDSSPRSAQKLMDEVIEASRWFIDDNSRLFPEIKQRVPQMIQKNLRFSGGDGGYLVGTVDEPFVAMSDSWRDAKMVMTHELGHYKRKLVLSRLGLNPTQEYIAFEGLEEAAVDWETHQVLNKHGVHVLHLGSRRLKFPGVTVLPYNLQIISRECIKDLIKSIARKKGITIIEATRVWQDILDSKSFSELDKIYGAGFTENLARKLKAYNDLASQGASPAVLNSAKKAIIDAVQ